MMGIETMKSVSPKTVDRSTLVQRSSIRLDPAAPQEVRLREFIKQIPMWITDERVRFLTDRSSTV